MSSVSDVSQLSGVQTTEQASTSQTSGTQEMGKDAFLRLLTTQLQHQDPLNPVDNTEFITQLSQFSSLEQLTNANDKLESLAAGMSSVGSATMVNMIGKEVQAVGDGFHYESGTKSLYFGLDTAADAGTISIYDENGSIVLQESLRELEAGEHSFEWDGLNSNGTQSPEGDYTFSISATNAGESVEATTYTVGLVDQLDFSSGVAAPRVDGQTLTVDKIIKILDSEAALGD